jgi:hypothetical protein
VANLLGDADAKLFQPCIKVYWTVLIQAVHPLCHQGRGQRGKDGPPAHSGTCFSEFSARTIACPALHWGASGILSSTFLADAHQRALHTPANPRQVGSQRLGLLTFLASTAELVVIEVSRKPALTWQTPCEHFRSPLHEIDHTLGKCSFLTKWNLSPM